MMQDFTPVNKMDKAHYALDVITAVLGVIIVVKNVQIAIAVTPVMIAMIVMIVIVAMLAMIVMVAMLAMIALFIVTANVMDVIVAEDAMINVYIAITAKIVLVAMETVHFVTEALVNFAIM